MTFNLHGSVELSFDQIEIIRMVIARAKVISIFSEISSLMKIKNCPFYTFLVILGC